jgi:hypothetical protein
MLFILVFTLVITQVNLKDENGKNTDRKNVWFPYDSININFLNYYNQIVHKSSIDDEKSFLRPQSFSILMNFGQDGQQSVMLIDQETVLW